MEIWLKLDDKNVKDFRFPVVPNDFDFETSNIINSSNITKLGEVSFYGGDNTSPLEIKSFFPSKNDFLLLLPTLQKSKRSAWSKGNLRVFIVRKTRQNRANKGIK